MSEKLTFNPESPSERLAHGHIPVVYWDAGIFLNLISHAALPEVRELVDLAGWWQVRIVTSALTLVELLKQDKSRARYRDGYLDEYLFNTSHIHLVSLHDQEDPAFFIRTARAIRIAHSLDSDGKPRAKTVGSFDALHLATAIGCNVGTLHTRDRGRRSKDLGLLQLNRKVLVGSLSIPLRITLPDLVQGDAAAHQYHRVSCPSFSRAYKILRDNKPIEPEVFQREHPTFLGTEEAEACGYSACPECDR